MHLFGSRKTNINDVLKIMIRNNIIKHRIVKQNIIKQIKDRSLFKSVPETYTIQNVLGFLNTIFERQITSSLLQ